jgi:uncharacterized protein YqeY
VSTNLRARLRTALSAALKERDAVRVSVLRTTLAALDNAEAVPVPEPAGESRSPEVSPVGVGARDVARRDLSDEEVERLVRAEISERRHAAEVYEQAGEHDHALRLRQEAGTLAAVAGLSGDADPTNGVPERG